jgi:hypothetical protein
VGLLRQAEAAPPRAVGNGTTAGAAAQPQFRRYAAGQDDASEPGVDTAARLTRHTNFVVTLYRRSDMQDPRIELFRVVPAVAIPARSPGLPGELKADGRHRDGSDDAARNACSGCPDEFPAPTRSSRGPRERRTHVNTPTNAEIEGTVALDANGTRRRLPVRLSR